ncbi:MAG: hypothetical protein QM813_19430 [Verrucomicrobiota bacterium]
MPAKQFGPLLEQVSRFASLVQLFRELNNLLNQVWVRDCPKASR